MRTDLNNRKESNPTSAGLAHHGNGQQHPPYASKEASRTLNERLEAHLGDALANLGDRAVLNASPLSRTVFIEKLASTRYSNKIMARGLALRQVITDCIARLRAELGNEPTLSRCCTYLELRSQGVKCRQIGKELNVSREHASRMVRRQALHLLAEAFLAATRNGNQPG